MGKNTLCNEPNTIEYKLRNAIRNKYGSVKTFSQKLNIPISTLYSALSNGILKSSYATVIAICDDLSISPDALGLGYIVSKFDTERIQELTTGVKSIQSPNASGETTIVTIVNADKAISQFRREIVQATEVMVQGRIVTNSTRDQILKIVDVASLAIMAAVNFDTPATDEP